MEASWKTLKHDYIQLNSVLLGCTPLSLSIFTYIKEILYSCIYWLLQAELEKYKHRNNAMNLMNCTSLHNLRVPSCPLGIAFCLGPVFPSVGPSFPPPSSRLRRCRCIQHRGNRPLPFYHRSELSASHCNTQTTGTISRNS